MTCGTTNDIQRGGSSGIRPASLWGAAGIVLAAVLGLAEPWRAAPAAAETRCCARGPLADSLVAAASPLDAQAAIGILAVSLDTGDTLVAIAEDRRLIPGSNAKLFTTSAFLKRYGTGTRFTTRIEARGKVDRKKAGAVRLKGDLVLRPTGTPDVTQLLAPGSRGLVDSLAFLLRAGGLERFEGTVWVDGTLFATDPYGPGWALEDVPYSYGALTSPVLANGNAATVIAEGRPNGVALSLDPPETPLTLVRAARVGEGSTPGWIDVSRAQGSRALRVTGSIPRGGTLKKQVAVFDPDSTAGLWLLGAMRRAGIRVGSAAVRLVPHASAEGIEGADGDGTRKKEKGGPPPSEAAPSDTGWAAVRRERSSIVLSFLSPPAAAMVGVVHALSLNAESEGLLRLLDGAPREKQRTAGLGEARRAASLAGIDTLDLSLVDGSGLSPQNLVTARAIVRLLTGIARDSSLATPFREGLASPGQSGTLRRRFANLEPGVELRAKTGTLTNVSSLAGYVTQASGRRIAFAVITNGNRGSTASAKQLEERLVGMLARWSGVGGLGDVPPPRIPR